MFCYTVDTDALDAGLSTAGPSTAVPSMITSDSTIDRFALSFIQCIYNLLFSNDRTERLRKRQALQTETNSSDGSDNSSKGS